MKVMIIVLVFAGIAMIGQGSRMIYQGVFCPGSYYSPNLFDIFFDWTSLTLMGAVVFGWGITQYYKDSKTNA